MLFTDFTLINMAVVRRWVKSMSLAALNTCCTHGYLYQSSHLGLISVSAWLHVLKSTLPNAQSVAGIDIFSPRLDLSSNSPHAKRRIWQEAITTLLLADEHCRIPKEQKMDFKQARSSEYPPYLLNFKGSPGERHVENLKVSLLRPLPSVD